MLNSMAKLDQPAPPFLHAGREGDNFESVLPDLMAELEHYKNQSLWLSRTNELHSRLAGAVDVSSIIEAFSIWLMPLAAHDLIAYKNLDRQREHFFCSCHGPERRQALKTAEEALARLTDQDEIAPYCLNNYYAQAWEIISAEGRGVIILLRRDRLINQPESQIVANALEILNDPLQRALVYDNLYEQASRDTLTGMANRRVFEERINPIMESAVRHGHPLTIASMDLDKFKQINDRQGHAAGDRALQMVARTMAASIRGSDLLVRMGGDEFLLLMPDTDLQSAQILAQRLWQKIDRLSINTNGVDRLGISIGIVQWQPGLTKNDWLQLADDTLYKAKGMTRTKVCAA